MMRVRFISVPSLTLLTCFREFIDFAQRATLGEEILGCFGPLEGLWLRIVSRQMVVDRGLQIIDAGITAAPDAPVCDLSKEALHKALVGVKCSLKRGCLAAQPCTSGVLWLA